MQDLEFRVVARAGGELCDPLAQGLSLPELCQVLRSALQPPTPTPADLDAPELEMSGPGGTDCLEVVPAQGQGGGPALLVRAGAADVGSMQELRDRVLSGDFDAAAARELGQGARWSLHADRTEFAEQYEERALALRALTPHQQEKLQECMEGGLGTDVHLRAPAGAGKTFVALHRVLDALQSQASARALFVARNEALACFAASWLGKRVRGRRRRRELLARLSLLYEPFEQGIREVTVKNNCVEMQAAHAVPGAAVAEPYALVVVDEAHHLYSDAAARELVERQVTAGTTRRFLLSDLSQSLGRGVAYPDGLREVALSEVVRCSQRIVAGAMAFQLGGEEKLLTKCHHEAVGPPLQSFLFDLPSAQAEGDGFFEAYAEHTLQAMEHVVAAFPGLSLHNRLAIVVPSSEFLEGFRPVLARALAEHFKERRLRLVAAAVASCDLGPGGADEEEEQGAEPAGEAAAGEDEEPGRPEEWLLLDTVHQVDGLERLVVLGVGLDTAIRSEDADSTAMDEDAAGSKALEARSMLYRAVTRAHLMFLVVNEFLRGGFLEFLGSIRLLDDEAFDSSAELARSEAQAVEGVVLAELSAAVAAAARERGLQLDERAVSALTSDVAAARERGEALGVALEAVLRSWSMAWEQVAAAFRALADQPSPLPCPDASTLAELMGPATLDCYRGEVVNLSLVAAEALKKRQAKDLEEQAGAALEAAARAGGHDLGKRALGKLRGRVVFAAERGQSPGEAAAAAVRDFVQARTQISEAMRREQEAWGRAEALPQGRLEEALESALISVACHGEAVEQAVKSAVYKLSQEVVDLELTAALERLAEREAAGASPSYCRAGLRVRLANLQGQAELNGEEGVLVNFIPATGRWAVELSGRSKPIAVRPVNVEPLECHEQQPLPAPPSLLEAASVLKPVARLAVQAGLSAEDAAAAVANRWRTVEAQVTSVLEEAAAARRLQPSAESLAGLVRLVTESQWRLNRLLAPGAEEEGEELEEEPRPEPIAPLAEAVEGALEDWERREHSQQQEAAQIVSAIEAAAGSERLLLTDAALSSLQGRVAAALRRGEDMETAVASALREYRKQVVRKQVRQTVWDPSGNSTRKVTGVLRFMPFKQKGSERFEYELLVSVFTVLPFRQLGELARVCKRWRSVAADPSWKPELVAYAWGDARVTGLARACPRPTLLEFSVAKRIVKIACADAATLALTEEGTVWFWGKSWLSNLAPNQVDPTLVPELRDVVSLATSPPGYFHERSRLRGYACAAVTRGGDLYTWGLGRAGQLLHEERGIPEPRRVVGRWAAWQPAKERAVMVALGLDFLALCVRREQPQEAGGETGGSAASTAVLSCGIFNHCKPGRPHELHEWPQLLGVPLRQLAAGSFHCCALTTRGDLYTFGDEHGPDSSNGNLLGHGPPGLDPEPCAQGDLAFVRPPRRLAPEGLGPVAEVACSSYTTIATTVDGRVFSWGDCDGDALGHSSTRQCHTPGWLSSLRFQRVAHGSLAYTNGAVATSEGRVFVWGGNYWGGGIAEGRNSAGPTEVEWGGVPSCYKCSSAALAHRHGYLIFRKQP